jgi:spermidine synthase
VRRFTSVEINPGYLDVMQNYPDFDSIRTDPKVIIHVNDGRRWLLRQPEAKLTFILMNTSFH